MKKNNWVQFLQDGATLYSNEISDIETLKARIEKVRNDVYKFREELREKENELERRVAKQYTIQQVGLAKERYNRMLK